MDFRLLGPLEVHADGVSVPLGGRKQRTILALLLLEPNQVVSIDRMIDELWGERPPKTVEAYIQNCISRLRVVLGHELIQTRSPGYLIAVDPETVDAHRFVRAVEEAPALAPAERGAALREALALWRGAGLADLVFEGSAQIDVARLDELRLQALELRLDAELELGRHDAVLAEVDALARRHPEREKLRYLQMLALYRCGRQRDALSAYHEARLDLIENFGLEPSASLRALERLIISHDPSLQPGLERSDQPQQVGRPQKNIVALLMELVVDGRLDEELEHRWLAASLSEIALVVEQHGGEVHELLRDEISAVFGHPQSHEDDAMRALRAATEIRATLPSGISVRGALERVAGPSVGVLRPMLEAAAPGELLLGPAVLRLVPQAVDVVPHVADSCYRLLRFDSDADPIGRRLDTPFVGRSIELERLAAAFADVERDRVPRRLALIGEVGIGKTRLVREFLRRARPNAAVLSARCAAYGAGTDLLPVRDVLAQIESPESILSGQLDAERVLAQLRDPSLTEKSELFWALRRLLAALAEDRSVLLVFDDVHWAGPTFLDLVEYLVGWTAAPLFVLALGRPELLEARPEWRENALILDGLATADAFELAGARPGEPDLDASVVAKAVETAEGNPLFLEQLLAAGAEQFTGPVPPTIEVLIESRLDRLPHDERVVLERASIAGPAFWRRAVEAATPEGERATVSDALMALVRRRLIRPERSQLPGEDGFRFHHVLIREVVYAGVPVERRAALHESIAWSLDSIDQDFDELVGYHLEQAALLHARSGARAPAIAEEAGRRLSAAGLRALKRVDGRAAIDLLTRAVALLPDDASRLELEWALAASIKFAGDDQRADEQLEQVAEKAKRCQDERIELRARIEQLWLRLVQSRLTVDAALALLARALTIFQANDDHLGVGRALDITGAINGVYRLRYGEAEPVMVKAGLEYERSGFGGGLSLARLAVVAHRGSTPAGVAIERCEALRAQAPTPVWESFILPPLAVLEAMEGHFDRARTHLEEARVGREEFSDTGTIATSWAALAAEVELLAAEPERAEAILRRSCETLRASRGGEWLATNTAMLGETLYRQARFDEARTASESALSIAPAEHLTSRTIACRVQMKTLARLGQHDAAIDLAKETLRSLEQTDVLDERGEALAASAEVLSLTGAGATAAAHWDEALAMFEAKGNTISAERVRRAAAVFE